MEAEDVGEADAAVALDPTADVADSVADPDADAEWTAESSGLEMGILRAGSPSWYVVPPKRCQRVEADESK
jgi:hypothetical protein